MSLAKQMIAMRPNLFVFALGLCKRNAQAEDLVQETYLKAWANRGSFQKDTNLRAWLFMILRNTYFSQRRKHRRETEDVDGREAMRMTTPANQYDSVRINELSWAWLTLSIEHQEAVMLVCVEGVSYEDAGEMLGIAMGTVKSRVNRARIALSELLGEELFVTELDNAWNSLKESCQFEPVDEELPSIFNESAD